MKVGRFGSAGLVALTLLLSGARAGAASPSYRTEPRPAWVRPTAVPEVAAPSEGVREDLQLLLIEEQDRFSPEDGLEQYRHLAQRLVTQDAVHDESELSIDFDPGFQELTVHSVVIHRGTETLDVTQSSQTRMTSRQTDLSARIYDDGVELHFLIPGTRVGDVIEYEYTKKGQNPAMRGHFSASHWVARSLPVERFVARLLYRGNATLRTQSVRSQLAPTRSRVGDYDEWEWRQNQVPGFELEDHVPSDFGLSPKIELTDFATWKEVVTWALPLYDKPGALTPEVEKLLETWKNEPLPARQLEHAVRFVQDEIRYLGIEVGPNSYEPRAPLQVLQDRFGDCKDKGLLLVTLLRRLGIEAVPVLVASDSEKVTPDNLPSPRVFDHVIVRATLDGTPLFIDGTRTMQRGGVENLRASDFGYVLPIAARVEALEKMPQTPSSAGAHSVVETFQIKDRTATLDVFSEFRGDEAVSQRRRYAAESREKITRTFENFYAKTFPSLRVTRPLLESDDEVANTVQVQEHYAIDEFFSEGRRGLSAWAIRSQLVEPRVVKRAMPLSIPYPVDVKQTLVVDWDDADFEVEPVSLELPEMRFERHATQGHGHLTIEYHLVTLTDRVAPQRVAAYLEAVEKILDDSGYELYEKGVPGSRASSTSLAPLLWAMPVSVVVVLAGYAFWSQKHKRLWKAKFRRVKGETPANAIPRDSVEDAKRTVAALRCTCGTRVPRLDAEESFVRFGDRRILVVKAPCSVCGEPVTRYFTLPARFTQ